MLSQDDKATVERTFAIVEDTISEYIYIEQEENKEIYLFSFPAVAYGDATAKRNSNHIAFDIVIYS